MTRLTQRGATGPISPFKQATSVSTGTGDVDPSFITYVGQKFDTSDGREMVLVSNGAVALAAGVLVQAAAEDTNFEKLAMTVPAAYPATAGSTKVLVTASANVLNEGLYDGGYLIVASGTGIGQMLKIAHQAPAASAATFVVTLEDPIVTTLDATSKITLIQNPYANVIISPTSHSAGPVGVSLYPLAAAVAPTWNGTTGVKTAAGTQQYGLIVSHGPVSCLVDSTVTNVGYPLGVSATTAGTVGVATLTTAPQIAVSAQTLTSANNGLIFLQL